MSGVDKNKASAQAYKIAEEYADNSYAERGWEWVEVFWDEYNRQYDSMLNK